MLSTLAYFELLTLTDGSYRRRCCVRRIILTRTLAFGRRRCRPLQQGCCRSNTRRFHRQDRRKSTLECRQEEKAFPKTPAKNEPKAEIGLVFISSCFSPRFLKPGSCKRPGLRQKTKCLKQNAPPRIVADRVSLSAGSQKGRCIGVHQRGL